MVKVSGNKYKILMVLGALNFGGAEIFCLSLVKSIDRNKYQLDFVVNSLRNSEIEKELVSLGCKIHVLPRFNGISFLKHKKIWRNFLENNKYDIVHGHASGAMSLYLSVAKECGCRTIAHSHSASNRGNFVVKFAKKFWSKNAKKYADYWLACSDLAAKRLFGRDFNTSSKYVFIPNGIDADRFAFSENQRNEIRDEYSIRSDEILVGHVGSFTKPKNHIFLLRTFKELSNKNDNYRLMLCGDGPVKKTFEKKASRLGLLNKIILVGNTKEPEKFYSAFDVFVFPSLFEGLPVSLIEAQCNGLPIVCSDKISKNVLLSGNIKQESLNNRPLLWAKVVDDTVKVHIDRDKGKEVVQSSAFVIQNTKIIIECVYEKLINK